MVRPKKPTHAVELPRDCWEKIFSLYLEVAAPERSGVPEMPEAPRPRPWQWDRFGNPVDPDPPEQRMERELIQKRRSDHTRACARTLIGLRRVCKLFREILDEREVGGPMYDVMWRRVREECGRPRMRWFRDGPEDVHDVLEVADSLAPRGMTSLQKLTLACEKGCQCCDRRPITRKVIWQFGVRICSLCARDKTVLERDLELNPLVRPEHYEDLPSEYIALYTRYNQEQLRVRRFWKASVVKRREVTMERDKRLRESAEAAKLKAEKEKKRKARLANQLKLDEVRAERKRKMTTILGKHVRDINALETSETFRKFSAVARPLSVEFEIRHMRKILGELPNEALAPHAQH